MDQSPMLAKFSVDDEFWSALPWRAALRSLP